MKTLGILQGEGCSKLLQNQRPLLAREMKRRKLTKTAMAGRMKTSRAGLERLLDPDNRSVTLLTLERAASVLGKKLRIEFA